MHSVMRAAAPVPRAALVAVLVAACAPEPQIVEVELDAHDFAFVLPDTISGGLVRFQFANHGREDHHAQFIRLNDGVTREQFDSLLAVVMEAVPTEGDVAFMRLFEIVTLAGGPAVIAPGVEMAVTTDLSPGEYILLCFVPSPDGIPHLAKGMRRWLTVTAPSGEVPEPPAAAARVDMADFAFTEVSALDSGEVVLEVTNSGQEPHEMLVLRLEGVSFEEMRSMVTGSPSGEEAAPAGPPPFRFVGGVQAMMPGQRVWVTLALPPGKYALVCFIPSPPNEGQSHAVLGMVQALTVG